MICWASVAWELPMRPATSEHTVLSSMPVENCKCSIVQVLKKQPVVATPSIKKSTLIRLTRYKYQITINTLPAAPWYPIIWIVLGIALVVAFLFYFIF